MKKLVVFTGAGVSADSGLATFRDSDGTWGNYRIEEVCIPEALDFNRRGVIRFYNERRAEMLKAEPNAAHRAIARSGTRFRRPGHHPECRQSARKGGFDAYSPPARGAYQTSFDGRSVAHPAVRRRRAGFRRPRLPTVRCCVRISSSSASRFPNSTVRRNLPPGPTS